MKSGEGAATVAREWVAKAENDLLNATHTLTLGRRCPTDTVCFHAQQCAEKYLKALLTLRGIDFPKTHDLEALSARLRAGRVLVAADDLALLTRYATVTRYPGAEEIPLPTAKKAIAAARRVRRAMRRLLKATVERPKRSARNTRR